MAEAIVGDGAAGLTGVEQLFDAIINVASEFRQRDDGFEWHADLRALPLICDLALSERRPFPRGGSLYHFGAHAGSDGNPGFIDAGRYRQKYGY